MTKRKSGVGKPDKSGSRSSAVSVRTNTFLFAVLSLVAVFTVGYLLTAKFSRNRADTGRGNTVSATAAKESDIQLKKEGELRFISKVTGKTIKRIDIEIADNEYERTQGLMYRSSMPDSAGMLFIFEHSQLRSFWMKNTIIPLDIIYFNENKEIVTIHKYTTPFSEASIFSYKRAQYVVEVNAGFCDRYKIMEGDRIVFSSAK